jgi:hypothetical protein
MDRMSTEQLICGVFAIVVATAIARGKFITECTNINCDQRRGKYFLSYGDKNKSQWNCTFRVVLRISTEARRLD